VPSVTYADARSNVVVRRDSWVFAFQGGRKAVLYICMYTNALSTPKVLVTLPDFERFKSARETKIALERNHSLSFRQ
jgi:hypothetical protein